MKRERERERNKCVCKLANACVTQSQSASECAGNSKAKAVTLKVYNREKTKIGNFGNDDIIAPPPPLLPFATKPTKSGAYFTPFYL